MPRRKVSVVIPEGQLAIEEFKGKEIRKALHNDEWYFSIIDVIEATAQSVSPEDYWSELRAELLNEGGDELFTEIERLEMTGSNGQRVVTEAANVETIFRIIQSVPSKRAEPFKRWLAKVGYERILEFQNPDIAIKRAILDYKLKGYEENWINNRVRSIVSRQALTSEWSSRGVESRQFGILTDLIHEKTFSVRVQWHKGIKELTKSHNLRDHMTSTELALTSLGETATREIAISKDAQGYYQNHHAAEAGGKIAGDARRALEKQTGERVVSKSNFLPKRGETRPLPES